MPPLIGDCIMVFPLINILKKIYDVTLLCNEYVYETVKLMQFPLNTKLLSDDYTLVNIIIDFLSNNKSAKYIQHLKPNCSIGFKDGFWNYDYLLKQPSEFVLEPASSIFLYALQILGIKLNTISDFSSSYKWEYLNQKKILLAPSAGNIDRCFSIDDFIHVRNELKDKDIVFLLGPKDKNIRYNIPSEYEIIETDTIAETMAVLSSAILVIASEGGFMHIAASYGIPLIGLFKVASPTNWFPYLNPNQFAIGEGTNNYTAMNKETLNTALLIEKANEIYGSIRN